MCNKDCMVMQWVALMPHRYWVPKLRLLSVQTVCMDFFHVLYLGGLTNLNPT